AGERIARELACGFAGWPVVARTVYFDMVITRLADAGEIGCVLNLAAGLDARPYRLDLPSTRVWTEVDLPEMHECKTRRLAGAARGEPRQAGPRDGEGERAPSLGPRRWPRVLPALRVGAGRGALVMGGVGQLGPPALVHARPGDGHAPRQAGRPAPHRPPRA